jgi:hypothetical protein
MLRPTPHRVFAACAILASAAVLSVIEARAVWGYALWPPSLEQNVGAIDRVLALSRVDFTGGFLQPMTNADLVQQARYCRAAGGQCWGADWILSRGLDSGLSDTSPQVPAALWRPVWDEFQQQGHGPGMWIGDRWQSMTPAAGTVVYFRARQQEWLFIGYNTSRGADERYGFAEALYSLGGPRPRLIAQTVYFYDYLDHLMGLGAIPLWIVNTILIVAGAALCRAAARARHPFSRAGVAVCALLLVAVVVGDFHIATFSMTAPGRSPGLIFVVASLILAAPALFSLKMVSGKSR